MNISPEQYAAQNNTIPENLERCPDHPNGDVMRYIDFRQWRVGGMPWLKEVDRVSYECSTCKRPLKETPPSEVRDG